MRVCPVLLAIAAVMALVHPLARAQQVEPGPAAAAAKVIELPSPALAAAVSEDAGTVAFAFPGEQRVRLYPKLLSDGDLSNPVEYPVGGAPLDVAHRRVAGKGVYLVLTHEDRTLHVLDDKTLQVVKKIALQLDRPIGLAAPTLEAVPYVYYVAGSTYQGTVGRVDLVAGEDQGAVEVRGQTHASDVGQIEVSADGRYLYGRRPGVSPTGERSFSLGQSATGKPQATLLVSRHDSSDEYVAHPHGQFAAAGRRLYSVDLARKITEWDEPVVAMMRTRPAALAVKDDQLLAYSLLSLEKLSTVSLRPPAAPAPAGAGGGQQRNRSSGSGNSLFGKPESHRVGEIGVRYPFMVLLDEGRGKLFVCRGNKAVLVSMAALNLPEQPLLFAHVTAPASPTITVGQAAEWTITPVEKQTEVVLQSGPTGMALNGNRLTWTPGDEQVGTATAVITLQRGGVSRQQDIPLRVSRPHVVLPFAPDTLSVSADGKRALVLLGSSEVRAQMHPNLRVNESRLAMVDLDAGRVVADRALPFLARQAAIDEHHVYVCPQESDALYVLSRTDLEDVKRIFLPGRPYRLTPAGGTLYVQVSRDHGAATLRYVLPDLQLSSPSPDEAEQQGRSPGTPVDAVAGGVFADGVYWANGNPALLVRPPDIQELNANGQRQVPGVEWHYSAGTPPPIARWGVRTTGTQLVRLSGQTLGAVPQGQGLILDDLPAFALLNASRDQNTSRDGTAPPDRAELVLHDLQTARQQQRILLYEEPLTKQPGQREAGEIAQASGRVVVVSFDRLYAIDTATLKRDLFPAPLHFSLQQSIVAIDPAKPTTIEAQAHGGKGVRRFAVLRDVPGITVDRGTGAMTIDPSAFGEQAVAIVQQAVGNRAGRYRGPGSTTQPASVEEMIDAAGVAARARFKQITGREARGFPVSVPADLSVRDEEQQLAILPRVVLFEVPVEAVVAKVRAQQEQEASAQHQRQQLQEQQRQAARAATQPAAAGADVESLRRRVAELERRNLELEAQNKLLRELMSNRGATSTGQPPATQP